jgi:hypothetical protein
MYFTLKEALKLSNLKQITVIGGEHGLNRNINSVSIMDNPDTSWVKRV